MAPQPGDQLQFGAAAQSTAHNDFPAGTSFQSIDFTAGGFTLEGNDLRLTDGIGVASGVTGATISLDVALAGMLTIDTAENTALMISGNLSGSNYLTKAGAGTLCLAGANTYSGGTVIEDGTLQVQNDAALVLCGNGFSVDGSSAVLDLNGNDVSVGQVGLLHGSITNNSATPASLTATCYAVLNGTIDVDLYGSDAPLLKGLAGAVTLSGTNSYTGPTTVYAGTLQLNGPDAWNPVFNGAGADIQDGKLVLDYSTDPGSDPAATVQADLADGYPAAFSSGPIQSSTAASSSTALGSMDNTTSQQVMIARVNYGDANLDGTVDSSDLGYVINNYNNAGVWSEGDFNYDGLINSTDFGYVISNYNHSLTALPPQVMLLARLGSAATTADNVQFVVVFSKDVSGVDANDFQLQCSGTSAAIASVAACSASNAVYLVTVDNVLGHGALGLNLIDNDTIVDVNNATLPLVGNGTDDGSFTGEVYTMTGPYVWDGGGADGNWSTAANWVDDVLPPAGSALCFTGTPLQNGCTDDRTGVAFQSIEFAASGFTISGTSDLPLTDGITVDAGVSDATISMNVTASSPITIDVPDADAQLTIDALSGSGSLTKTGEGTLGMTDDAHTGGTTVSAGTLLVGALPSVFAESLHSGVTFDTLLSSAAVVGDRGDSGGSFSWTPPAVSDGTLSLDANDGILNWTLGTGCQAATYPATVTYTYSGGNQIRAFAIGVKSADMPPAFCSPPGPQLWNYDTQYIKGIAGPDSQPGLVSASLAACDREGPITSYELCGDLPADAAIDSNGLFTCNLYASDTWHIYDFYVKATDSAGQYDLLHVLVYANGALAVAHDYPDVQPNPMVPYLVAVNSAGNAIYANTTSITYGDIVGYLNGVLSYTDPQHGTLAADPNDPRSVLYTPAQDYQGLDSFTYQWEYDQLDYWTHQPVGRLLTNVASQAIQVGNWVDLVPDNTYQNDPHHGISGVGEQETMTLTLQNPRGDGLPCTGCWSLNFDRNIVHVYTSDGNEILPNDPTGWGPIGSSIIETVPGYSSKEVTLTVVGVGGGTTGVDATWWVWGWGGGAQPGWMWKTYQNISYTVVGVDILRNGTKITNLTTTVIVGQNISLTGVVTPGDLEATSKEWAIPPDGRWNLPIANYIQTIDFGTVVDLQPESYHSGDHIVLLDR